MDVTPEIMLNPLQMFTDRLALRKFTKNDTDDVFVYQSQSDVARYLYRPPLSRPQCEEKIARISAPARWEDDGDFITFAVCEIGQDQVIGEIVLKLANARARQVEIGWVFNPAFWGRGFATEAALWALKFSFHELGAHRVFARLASDNEGSVKVCTRLGMRLEAHLVENDVTVTGDWGSEFVFASLESDLPSAAPTKLDRYRPALHGKAAYLASRDSSTMPEASVQLSTAEAPASVSRSEPGGKTWHDRVEKFWTSADENKPELVMAAMRQLVEERPEADPDATFEWASVHDFLGQEAEAIPLYRAAIADGLAGDRYPQAIIQLASSLRNEGEAEAAIDLLQGRATDTVTGSASQAFLALALHDSGQSRDALRVALDALAPTLPLYGPAVSKYANALVELEEDI